MEHGRDNAQVLLRKAAGDQISLRVLGQAEEEGLDWSWAFHAQQAIEKSIKAVLAHHGVKYPYIHRLANLAELLEASGLPLPPHADKIDRLSPFGALNRYEAAEEPSTDGLDPQELLEQCTDIIEWAERRTGLSSKPKP